MCWTTIIQQRPVAAQQPILEHSAYSASIVRWLVSVPGWTVCSSWHSVFYHMVNWQGLPVIIHLHWGIHILGMLVLALALRTINNGLGPD